MGKWRFFPSNINPIDRLVEDLPKKIAIIGSATNVIQARRDGNKDALENALDDLERTLEDWLPGPERED